MTAITKIQKYIKNSWMSVIGLRPLNIIRSISIHVISFLKATLKAIYAPTIRLVGGNQMIDSSIKNRNQRVNGRTSICKIHKQ